MAIIKLLGRIIYIREESINYARMSSWNCFVCSPSQDSFDLLQFTLEAAHKIFFSAQNVLEFIDILKEIYITS